MVAGLVVSGMAALAWHHYAGGGSGIEAGLNGITQSAVKNICADQNAYNSTASSPGDTTNDAQLGQAIQSEVSPAAAKLLNGMLSQQGKGGTDHLCPAPSTTTSTAP